MCTKLCHFGKTTFDNTHITPQIEYRENQTCNMGSTMTKCEQVKHDMDLYGMNRYKAVVAEETVEMKELWLWNDETADYQVVTMADPDVIIYDRPGASLFLKGELPFIQVCPNPQFDYYCCYQC